MYDRTFGWRDELKTIVIFSLLALGLAGAFVWRRSAPQTYETAKVVRFGTYADNLGNHPTLVVATSDGTERQIETTPELLRDCKAGSNIKLIVSPHHSEVAPAGCQ